MCGRVGFGAALLPAVVLTWRLSTARDAETKEGGFRVARRARARKAVLQAAAQPLAWCAPLRLSCFLCLLLRLQG